MSEKLISIDNLRQNWSSPMVSSIGEGNIVVKLTNGMGNQMFQYACGYALAKSANTQFYYDSRNLYKKEDKIPAKRYFELDVFNLTGVELLGNKFPRPDSKLKGFVRENSFSYSPEIFLKDESNLYINGYFQSEKYFKEFERDIKTEFIFKEGFNEENSKIAEEIEKNNSVSIHIRRGDYCMNRILGLCSLSYYDRAIEFIINKTSDPAFFIFSDEPDWAKENIKIRNVKVNYISNNTGKDSSSDLRLMSLCKHNVIANSTFSWWAAWLNSNPGKIVIAPDQWFTNKYMNSQTKDLIPESWFRL